MIEWWGPIIQEYYSATEGMGATHQQRAIAHAPGLGGQDDARTDPHRRRGRRRIAGGPSGLGVFRTGTERPTFQYHKDPQKTAETLDAHGATVGDMGYLDEEGFLYLTDRRTFMIVSGGVNIYPQEAENVLINHPQVLDVAVFGIPDPDMGEQVHAVVQPAQWDDAGPELERELLAYCPNARALQVPEGGRLRA